MQNRSGPSVTALLILLGSWLLALPEPCASAILVDCSEGGVDADAAYRGFYVSDYPGTTLDEVDLWLLATEPGEYEVWLKACAGTYDGEVLDMDTVNLTFTEAGGTPLHTTFVFPAVAVVPHSTVTFLLNKVSGPGNIQYVYETSNAECPVVQTSNQEPPLSTHRRDGIRIAIRGTGTTPVDESTWGLVKARYR